MSILNVGINGIFKSRVSHAPWGTDTPLLTFGKRDKFTIGDSFEGVAILGGTGSGKTSASGYQLSLSMLQQMYGALVLTAKVDEVHRWKKLAALAGRSNDLIIFDEEHGSQFNFLTYLSQRQRPGSGIASALMLLIEELAEGIERMSGLKPARGDEQFWKSITRLLANNAIELCQLAGRQVTIPDILEIIRDAPKSIEQANDPNWQRESVTFLLIEHAKTTVPVSAMPDLREIAFFFLYTFAGLAEKTRSIIEANLLGILTHFSRGTLARLFCKGTTVTPDDIITGGKIVVVNLPIKQFYGMGFIAQTIWKDCFQMGAEQRTSEEKRPCILYMDEAQNFLGLRDMHFAATARSSKVCNLWLTQNLSNVLVSLGSEESGKAAADSLMGLAMTKIFHCNSDPLTNQWAADLIGRRKQRMRSASMSPSPYRPGELFPPPPQASFSSSQSYEYAVQPHEFSLLQKGGLPDLTAEAIVVQSGRRFKTSGELYCRVLFKQGF